MTIRPQLFGVILLTNMQTGRQSAEKQYPAKSGEVICQMTTRM